MLKACGVQVQQSGTTVSVKGPAKLSARNWVVPGDISSAAFFLVASALIKNSNVVLNNVILNPTRTGLLDAMKNAGVSFEINSLREVGGEPVGDIRALPCSKLKGFNLDAIIAPRLIDEVPILAVLATQAQGTSSFRGLEELRVKETDRLKAMAENLSLMGAKVKEEADGLTIQGPTRLRGAKVKSFTDHRIAMAMAIAGLVADGETEIDESEAVSISFPDFWAKLKDLQK
jgi:3-phosphoshikimate 1-carboxyvinyltransferase